MSKQKFKLHWAVECQLRVMSFYLSWNLKCLCTSLSCLIYSRLLLVINVSCWANRVHLQSVCMSWNICLCKFCKEKYPMSAVPYERTVYKIMENMKLQFQCWKKIKCDFFFFRWTCFTLTRKINGQNNMLMLGKSPCSLSSFLYGECIHYHSAYIF